MLIIQRPIVEPFGEPEHSASASPSGRSTRASVTRSGLAPPHAALVNPRGGGHPGPLRRGPARVHLPAGREGGRERHHLQPEGSRAALRVRRAGDDARRRARARPTSPAADIRTTSDVEVLNPEPTSPLSTRRGAWRWTSPWSAARATHRPSASRPPPRSASSRSTPSSRRCGGSPSRWSRPGSRSDRLRPARARHRDRRLDQPARGPRLGRRDAAQLLSAWWPISPTRARASSSATSAPPPPARPTSTSDRGPRPLRAPAQLPEAGADQHRRRADPAHARRAARRSPTSARSRSTRCSSASTSGAWPCGKGRP